METKFIAVVLVATVLGALIGFGIAYAVLQPQIQNLVSTQEDLTNTTGNLQNQLGALNSTVANLNSTVNEIKGSEWHRATSLEGSSNIVGPLFEIKGNWARIRWTMYGLNATSWIQIILYYQNGTGYAFRGSSGVFSSYACDLRIVQLGYYYIEILTYAVDEYVIAVWDYY